MTLEQTGFEILIASSPAHECVTAEIYYEGLFVALLNSDDGLDRLNLEWPGTDMDERQVTRRVRLHGFLNALEQAAKMLRGDP